MKKIPTAEEFLENFQDFPKHIDEVDESNITKVMIEFAKLHVEAALKAASEQAEVSHKPKFPGDVNWTVDMDSILNSYPLENIK